MQQRPTSGIAKTSFSSLSPYGPPSNLESEPVHRRREGETDFRSIGRIRLDIHHSGCTGAGAGRDSLASVPLPVSTAASVALKRLRLPPDDIEAIADLTCNVAQAYRDLAANPPSAAPPKDLRTAEEIFCEGSSLEYCAGVRGAAPMSPAFRCWMTGLTLEDCAGGHDPLRGEPTISLGYSSAAVPGARSKPRPPGTRFIFTDKRRSRAMPIRANKLLARGPSA